MADRSFPRRVIALLPFALIVAGCAAPPLSRAPAAQERVLNAIPAPAVEKADRVLVLKSQRRLELLHGGVPFKIYPIALGSHPKGPKRQEGDGRTPEGVYLIDWRSAHSLYHLALHISYPDDFDRANARRRHISPGDAIFIHGMPESFGHSDPVRFFQDWTDGCIAVGNIAIEEIWKAVDDGTPIEIKP